MSKIPENCDCCGYFIEGANYVCVHDDAHGVVIKDVNKLPEMCPIKEDELDAVRLKVQYRGENFYMCIALYNNTPWEIFIEHATKGEPSLQYMMAGWDTVTRFVTLALKILPLHDVVEQLNKSSRQRNDLPAIISNALQQWDR